MAGKRGGWLRWVSEYVDKGQDDLRSHLYNLWLDSVDGIKWLVEVGMDTRADYSDYWDFNFVKRHVISDGKISEYILHHPIYENSLFPDERCLVCLFLGRADVGDPQ